MGPPHEPSCQLPPVVDAEAQKRLMKAIEQWRAANPPVGAPPAPLEPAAQAAAELLYQGETPAGGWYVPPVIFGVSDPHHPLTQEELFGPVLAVMHVDSFERALDVAMNSPYALTASVFSRTPSHLELARRSLHVGNLYLNRACTGAMVGRQPFGGLGMSGYGAKAGGPGYLMQFAEPRVVTENTMRRGVAPELIG